LSRRLPLLLFAATVVTTLAAGSGRSPGALLADPSELLEGVPFAASLLVILGAHEFSHYLTSRRHGIEATLPMFIPAPSLVGTFGAIIRIKSPIPDRRSLVELGISGPLGGFLVAVSLAVAGLRLSHFDPAGLPPAGEGIVLGDPLVFRVLARLVLGPAPAGAELVLHPIALAAWFGFFVTSINLLPVGQLDGGHVLYALTSRRQPALSRAVVLLLAPLGFLWWGWFMWGAMLLLLGIEHPPVVHEEPPLDRGHRALGWVGAALLALTFTPAPFSF
jgi:membrane-associated protease RseP (regulator of RpoE activity)